MNTYKITNITNNAGKREFKFNSPLNVEYVDNLMKKTVVVKPGESLYLTVSDLPMSVHKLRIKNLVTVEEVSQGELESMMNAKKHKPVAAPVLAEVTVSEEVSAEETARKSSRKRKE